MKRLRIFVPLLMLVTGALFLLNCNRAPRNPNVLDEAKRAGREAPSFTAADEDYFHDMDGGVQLTTGEVRGRNNWIVWTAGNDRFWDLISKDSVGTLDFLKSISSHSGLKFSRDNRWRYLGLVNEPCFDKPTAGDPNRFGLWLDKRRSSADCPPDPFENEQKYPGVKVGARGKNMPVGSFYGYATGIVGMRLFPNPDFDEAAAKKWDAEKYYTDETYYDRRDLVKPYRVGMSCGFCHVGPNPLKPPDDPENPKWENLSSNVGAQYFWVDRIFAYQADPTSFMFQLFHTSRPGSLDTSLVSTDNINNPRTMNAVYYLGPRLENAKHRGKETLARGGLNNKQFNDYVASGPLTQFFQKPATVWTPRVLKDGADSVGALGALNRVFVNIGEFSEEWLQHFNALVGGKPTSPIEILEARRRSTYWNVTESQTPDLALFFLKTTNPHHLIDAPGGAKYLADAATIARGKLVFADTCARCHSSKLPDLPPDKSIGSCAGSGYMDCWNRYWQYTKTDEFKHNMRAIVARDDFLENNFLSTELRVPVTLLQTNACSPLARNGLAGNIWDNFTSQSYKDLPSVGTIKVRHPITGEVRDYVMPAGGRGYTRPASLVSIWSTAPFLLNNTVGKFNWSPSVEARLDSFEDSIEKMLWPEKREKDSVLGSKGVFFIDRTTDRCYIHVPAGYVPPALLKIGMTAIPEFVGQSGVAIGPIPAGTPVNLLANIGITPDAGLTRNRLKQDTKLLDLLIRVKKGLIALGPNPTDDAARKVFEQEADRMLEVSNCPDFEVNRGHYFGTDMLSSEEPGLSDAQKRDLIEFLKTL